MKTMTPTIEARLLPAVPHKHPAMWAAYLVSEGVALVVTDGHATREAAIADLRSMLPSEVAERAKVVV